MELQKLNILSVQVDKNCYHQTEFANISLYKNLRITVYSEQVGNLYIIWSVDGIEKGLINSHKIQRDKWESFKFDVLSPFLQFKFVNGAEYNNKLLVNVLGQQSEEIKDKSFYKLTTKSPEENNQVLPQLVLRGNLLIVSDANILECLSPPFDNGEYVLCWSNGHPIWKSK